jgi:hypothetical protein
MSASTTFQFDITYGAHFNHTTCEFIDVAHARRTPYTKISRRTNNDTGHHTENLHINKVIKCELAAATVVVSIMTKFPTEMTRFDISQHIELDESVC